MQLLKRRLITCCTGLCLLLGGCASEPKKPDVILILIDTLRADHLGAYGYGEGVSSVIDAFARRATVFENAIAQAPHTIPSILQIMTSRYKQGERIEAKDETLAEIMRAKGYETVAIVENPHFESRRDARGLMRGFDRFYRNGVLHRGDLEQQHWKTKTPADAITAQAIRWLRTRNSQRPLFLWLHYFDPHDPYMPPFAENMEELFWNTGSKYTGDIRNTFLYKPSRAGSKDKFTDADRNHIVALYDAEIRYVDESLGELFKFLETSGLFEEALIVLSSDHGESLGEHGMWTHGRSLFEPEIHIPLIIKYPNQGRGERVASPTEAIDIVPTIIDVAGITNGVVLDGKSLRQNSSQPAFAFWKEWQVVRTEEWKLLRRAGKTSLFAIARDPAESNNLSDDEPEVVRRLISAQTARVEEIVSSHEELKAVSSETVEQMRALGYLK